MNWVVEPVFVTDTTCRSLAEMIAKALESAPLEGDPRYDPKTLVTSRRIPLSDPVLKASGLKSRSAFERGAKLFDVMFYDDRTVVQRWIPNRERGSGYNGIDDTWGAELGPAASAEDIARVIVDASPTTPTRPSDRLSDLPPSTGAMTFKDIPRMFERHVPEFFRVGDERRLDEAGGPPALVEAFTEFIDDLPDDIGDERSNSHDQLKRALALVELLMAEGDGDVRRTVVDEFIATDVALKPEVRKLLCRRTRAALRICRDQVRGRA